MRLRAAVCECAVWRKQRSAGRLAGVPPRPAATAAAARRSGALAPAWPRPPPRTCTVTGRRERVASLAGAVNARVWEMVAAMLLGCCVPTSTRRGKGVGLDRGERGVKEGDGGGSPAWDGHLTPSARRRQAGAHSPPGNAAAPIPHLDLPCKHNARSPGSRDAGRPAVRSRRLAAAPLPRLLPSGAAQLSTIPGSATDTTASTTPRGRGGAEAAVQGRGSGSGARLLAALQEPPAAAGQLCRRQLHPLRTGGGHCGRVSRVEGAEERCMLAWWEVPMGCAKLQHAGTACMHAPLARL